MFNKISKRNRIVVKIATPFGLLFVLFCIGAIGFITLGLIGGGLQNPNKRTILDPEYRLVSNIYPERILPDDNRNLLVFYTYDENGSGARVIVVSIKEGKVIKEQKFSDFDYTKDKYFEGPKWDNGIATFVVIGRYSQECVASYSTMAPMWQFTRGECSKVLAEHVITPDYPVRKPGLPQGADLSALGINWQASAVGVYAADAFDRSYISSSESAMGINDIRLFSMTGCTIAQIGGVDSRGDPEVALIGWTDKNELMVRRSGAKAGIYLIESSVIQDIVKRSAC